MATKPWENTPPTLVERYALAGQTSDLTSFGGMIAPGGGAKAAELLAAAGLAAAQSKTVALGLALQHLQSEWDAAAKPKAPGPRLTKALVSYIKEEDRTEKAEAERRGRKWKSAGDVNMRAIERAGQWYAGELRILAQSLRSKAQAVNLLTAWALLKGIDPEAVSEAVLIWLDPTCAACGGHGTKQIHGQPARQCHPCGATGQKHRLPDVAQVVTHMDYAVGVSKGGIVAHRG